MTKKMKGEYTPQVTEREKELHFPLMKHLNIHASSREAEKSPLSHETLTSIQ